MKTQFTYLLFNLLVALPPLFVALFWSAYRWQAGDWYRLLKVYIFVSLPFMIIDSFIVSAGWWRYNPDYVLGTTLFTLPIEEILFFFSVPFACLLLYRSLKITVPRLDKIPSLTPARSTPIIWVLMILILLIFSPSPRTILDAILASVVVGYMYYRQLFSQLVVVWLSLISGLFFIANTVLTALPIVIYNHQFGSSIRLGTIPVEDILYNLSLLLLCLLVFVSTSTRPPARAPMIRL